MKSWSGMSARSIQRPRSWRPRRCWPSVDDLYAAGADYVTVTRLSDAHELYKVIEAAQAGLLEDKRAETDALLSERREVLP